MKKWYKSLSSSEQRLFSVGLVLVMVGLAWSYIYLPMNRKLDSQVEIRNRIHQQLIEMESMGEINFNQKLSNLTIPPTMTFSTWVDQQLNQLGLQELVNRTEPIDANTLTIWLNNAPFDQVIDWLQSIQDSYGVKVDQIDVNLTDRSLGYTNIRMRLVKQ